MNDEPINKLQLLKIITYLNKYCDETILKSNKSFNQHLIECGNYTNETISKEIFLKALDLKKLKYKIDKENILLYFTNLRYTQLRKYNKNS